MRLIKIIGFISLCFSVIIQAKTVEDFNHNWHFSLEKQQAAHQLEFDDTQWKTVKLPHDWAVELPYTVENGAASTGFKPGGIGWYRKSFTLDETDKNQRIWLEFDGIYNNSDIWINGHHVGGRPYGYTSFSVDLTDNLNFGKQKNVVTVKVNRTAYVDTRWYTGSGIYRNVRLVKANPIHIPQWGMQITTPKVSINKATVVVNTQIAALTNQGKQGNAVLEIFDNNGKQVAKTSSKITLSSHLAVSQAITIESPSLWFLESPTLYSAKVSIYHNNKVVDESTSKFGIRSAEFDANKGFLLNGKQVKLKGVNLHHDAGALGVAVPKSIWRSRLEKLKSVGVNAIRLSHNPHSPELLDLCDEMGFLVNAEVFDEWDRAKDKSKIRLGDNNATGEISKAYNLVFNQWAERDAQDLVRRDFNHPSVIMWSIGNEIEWTYPYYQKSGVYDVEKPEYYKDIPKYDMALIQKNILSNNPDKIDNLPVIAKQLSEFIKAIDTSRPVTSGLVLPSVGFATGYADTLDVIGFNYRAQEYEIAHKTFPKAKIYGSENWGSWSEWQNVKDKDYVAGIFVWTGFAYKGESGPLPKMGLNISLFDFAGNKTPRGHFFEAMWQAKPKVWLGTVAADQSEFSFDQDKGWVYNARQYPEGVWAQIRLWEWYDVQRNWKYKAEQPVVVTAYTNTETTELFLNGKSLGKQNSSQFSEDGIVKWLVPYQQGELKIVGYNQGKAVTSDVINTHGKLASIKLIAERSTLSADGYDTVQIRAELFDKNNNLIPDSKHKIKFTIDGNYNQHWVDNGSEFNINDVRSTSVINHLGKASLTLQAGEENSRINVSASSNGIYSNLVIIESKR